MTMEESGQWLGPLVVWLAAVMAAGLAAWVTWNRGAPLAATIVMALGPFTAWFGIESGDQETPLLSISNWVSDLGVMEWAALTTALLVFTGVIGSVSESLVLTLIFVPLAFAATLLIGWAFQSSDIDLALGVSGPAFMVAAAMVAATVVAIAIILVFRSQAYRIE